MFINVDEHLECTLRISRLVSVILLRIAVVAKNITLMTRVIQLGKFDLI